MLLTMLVSPNFVASWIGEWLPDEWIRCGLDSCERDINSVCKTHRPLIVAYGLGKYRLIQTLEKR